MKSVEWKTYRTRFLVKAKQLSSSLSFVDHLGRQHCGRKGDYLVESSDGVISIAPRQIFEDIYVPMSLLGEPDTTEARTGETPICANTIGEKTIGEKTNGEKTIGEKTIGEKTANRSIASEPKFRPLRFEALEIEQLKLGKRPAGRRRVNDVAMPRQDMLQQDLAHQDGVRQDVVREPESAPVRRKLPQPCRDRRAPVSQLGLM